MGPRWGTTLESRHSKEGEQGLAQGTSEEVWQTEGGAGQATESTGLPAAAKTRKNTQGGTGRPQGTQIREDRDKKPPRNKRRGTAEGEQARRTTPTTGTPKKRTQRDKQKQETRTNTLGTEPAKGARSRAARATDQHPPRPPAPGTQKSQPPQPYTHGAQGPGDKPRGTGGPYGCGMTRTSPRDAGPGAHGRNPFFTLGRSYLQNSKVASTEPKIFLGRRQRHRREAFCWAVQWWTQCNPPNDWAKGGEGRCTMGDQAAPCKHLCVFGPTGGAEVFAPNSGPCIPASPATAISLCAEANSVSHGLWSSKRTKRPSTPPPYPHTPTTAAPSADHEHVRLPWACCEPTGSGVDTHQ